MTLREATRAYMQGLHSAAQASNDKHDLQECCEKHNTPQKEVA